MPVAFPGVSFIMRWEISAPFYKWKNPEHLKEIMPADFSELSFIIRLESGDFLGEN